MKNAGYMRGAIVLAAMILLGSCGYHLAGKSGIVISPDVQSLAILAEGRGARKMVPVLHRHLLEQGTSHTLVQPGSADAELRIGNVSETFQQVGFDAAGIAIAYRSILSGELSLWREGNLLRTSGIIQVQDDVFSEGSPTSIEASRERVLDDLRRRWVAEAWLRLSSGF